VTPRRGACSPSWLHRRSSTQDPNSQSFSLEERKTLSARCVGILAALRRLLHWPESLMGDSITLQLPVESTVDIRLVVARDPLSLIQPGFGLELLAGLTFPDSPEFEIWRGSQRRCCAKLNWQPKHESKTPQFVLLFGACRGQVAHLQAPWPTGRARSSRRYPGQRHSFSFTTETQCLRCHFPRCHLRSVGAPISSLTATSQGAPVRRAWDTSIYPRDYSIAEAPALHSTHRLFT
jgi:hypothetical protein